MPANIASPCPSTSGDVFIADTDHGAIEAARWGGPWGELTWLDAHHLRVRYDARAQIFLKTERVGEVEILYAPIGNETSSARRAGERR